MRKARIPILGYNFSPTGVWRTCTDMPWRGARVTSFDYKLVKDAPAKLGKLNDKQMWDNFTYFLKKVAPVAEETGVKLALHPDDPPVPSLAGPAKIFKLGLSVNKLVDRLLCAVCFCAVFSVFLCAEKFFLYKCSLDFFRFVYIEKNFFYINVLWISFVSFT